LPEQLQFTLGPSYSLFYGLFAAQPQIMGKKLLVTEYFVGRYTRFRMEMDAAGNESQPYSPRCYLSVQKPCIFSQTTGQ